MNAVANAIATITIEHTCTQAFQTSAMQLSQMVQQLNIVSYRIVGVFCWLHIAVCRISNSFYTLHQVCNTNCYAMLLLIYIYICLTCDRTSNPPFICQTYDFPLWFGIVEFHRNTNKCHTTDCNTKCIQIEWWHMLCVCVYKQFQSHCFPFTYMHKLIFSHIS